MDTETKAFYDHRIECLEANSRKYRQALKIISDSIIAGGKNLKGLAEAAQRMLKADEDR